MSRSQQNESDLGLLILHDRPEHYLDMIRERFKALRITCCRELDAMAETLARSQPDIALSYKFDNVPYSHAPIFACSSIKWVHVGGAGVDHVGPWDPRRVIVTNSAGALADFMADYVITAIQMANIGFPRYFHQQTEKQWRGRPWRPLEDQTLLIVGLGQNGRRVAARARSRGMRVIGIRKSTERAADVDEQLPPERLREALARADFVALHVPLTESTRGLIDAEALARMKPTAWIVNTSRGAVIDEAALVEALASGRIAGAVLDVFEIEPLPPESPLWSLKNVVITPHRSDSTIGWERRFAQSFCENLERWLKSESLVNVVHPDRGY